VISYRACRISRGRGRIRARMRNGASVLDEMPAARGARNYLAGVRTLEAWAPGTASFTLSHYSALHRLQTPSH